VTYHLLLLTFNVTRTQSVKDYILIITSLHWGNVGLFADVKLLHLSRLWASSLIKPSFFMSTFTHSFHVSLPFAPQLAIPASQLLSLGIPCPYHLRRPWLTTSSMLTTLNSPLQLCSTFPIPQWHTTHPSQHSILLTFQSSHIIHLHYPCLTVVHPNTLHTGPADFSI